MNEPLLPDDDRDLRLARRLGDQLAQGRPLRDAAPGDDALQALARYKETAAATEAPDADALWAAIAAETHPGRAEASPERAADRPTRARIYRLRPAWVAVAASLLVAVAAVWLLWPRTAPAELVAEAAGTAVTYEAPDGSVVTLRPYSALQQLERTDATLRYRLIGAAFFDVTERPARTFVVDAGPSQVTVLGTAFAVRARGGDTEVYLQEGRVRFAAPRADTAVVLAPGQAAVLTRAGQLTTSAPASAAPYVDWLDGELQFEQQTLRQIADELVRHYGVTIDVAAARQDETLTGRLPLGSLAQTLADLRAAAGVRTVQIDAQTYFIE